MPGLRPSEREVLHLLRHFSREQGLPEVRHDERPGEQILQRMRRESRGLRVRDHEP